MVKVYNKDHFYSWLNELKIKYDNKQALKQVAKKAMSGLNGICVGDLFYRFNTYFDYDTKKYSNLEDAIAQKDYVLEVTLWKDN